LIWRSVSASSGRQWFVSSLNRSGRDAVRLLRSSRTTLLGDGLPVPFSRKRCTHRIAELPLTSNCSAAFICYLLYVDRHFLDESPRAARSCRPTKTSSGRLKSGRILSCRSTPHLHASSDGQSITISRPSAAGKRGCRLRRNAGSSRFSQNQDPEQTVAAVMEVH
jgi:hypothetical protein